MKTLYDLAKETSPRASGLVTFPSSSSVRRAICCICRTEIDQESAKWGRTKHMTAAIEAHLSEHDAARYEVARVRLDLHSSGERRSHGS